MLDALHKMEEDRKRCIINASLSEFSAYPYPQASTNRIVRVAGISKGLLYHYFGNKRNLYESLERFVIRQIARNVRREVDWDDPDLFGRIRRIILVKIALTRQYPDLYAFVRRMMEDRSLDELKAMGLETDPTLMTRVYSEGVDMGRFREDLDRTRVLEIVQWTFDGYAQRFMQDLASEPFDTKALERDVLGYVQVLRRAFYKQAYWEQAAKQR